MYDLAGLISPNLERTKAGYLPIDTFPYEDTPLPAGKKGFLLFLDEFNSGDRSTLAAAYKLVLDRKIGEHKLHPSTRIICAGNRMKDQAIVNKLGSALQTRLVHIEMDVNRKEFMEYIVNSNWNSILVSYFRFRPEMVNNFKPEDIDEVVTFAVPRSWEFVNKQLNAGLLNSSKEILMTALCGSVGMKAGMDFLSYLEIYKDLPSVNQITADPQNCPLPDQSNIGSKWAMTSYLSDKFTTSNEQALVTYIERMQEDDLKVLAYRMAVTKYTNLIKNTTVLKRLKGIRTLLAKQP